MAVEASARATSARIAARNRRLVLISQIDQARSAAKARNTQPATWKVQPRSGVTVASFPRA